MVVYEFYWHDLEKGYQLIGVLPERRKNSTRVNQESILNWAKHFFDKPLGISNIFFIPIAIHENTSRIFRPKPVFRIQKEI